MNLGKGYGFLGENIANINITSVLANGAMPGSAFTSSLVGNGLAFSLNGYAGVSSTASGSYLATNILIGFAGNEAGNAVGKLAINQLGGGKLPSSYMSGIIGGYLSGGGQWINELANK